MNKGAQQSNAEGISLPWNQAKTHTHTHTLTSESGWTCQYIITINNYHTKSTASYEQSWSGSLTHSLRSYSYTYHIREQCPTGLENTHTFTGRLCWDNSSSVSHRRENHLAPEQNPLPMYTQLCTIVLWCTPILVVHKNSTTHKNKSHPQRLPYTTQALSTTIIARPLH